MLVVVVLLIVVLALRRLVRSNTDARDARQILDERYTRGDINRDEYARKRRDLGS